MERNGFCGHVRISSFSMEKCAENRTIFIGTIGTVGTLYYFEADSLFPFCKQV